MKKTNKRFICAILAALMLASSFASCSKDDNPDQTKDGVESTADGEEVEKITKLTGIYRGESFEMPEGYEMFSEIPPLYDNDSGEFKMLLSKGEEILNEKGEYIGYRYSYRLNVYDRDLNEISSEELVLSNEEDSMNFYLGSGALTKDNLFYLDNEYNESGQKWYLCKYNFADKSIVKSDELSGLFANSGGDRYFYIERLCATPNGDIYLGASNEILVLNSDFIKQFNIPVNNWINSMSASPEGKVYISSYFDEGQGIAAVDTDKKALGDIKTLNDNVQGIAFGEGYDVYTVGQSGVYGVNLTDGSSELLMNFQSSDIDRDYFEILTVIDKDTILASERNTETWDAIPSLYKKSDDIDLSQIKVIEIAVGDYIPQNLNSSVISYNKQHKDSRIVVTDYSQYWSDEDYFAGVNKLATDIVNGLYKPDIVIGASYNNSAVEQLIANNLFIDLNTFIDSDSDISRDDIFGGVMRTFSTSDGKLWGITDQFAVQTLVGRSDTLGGMTSWTLDEMLDYALSLPEGTELQEGVVQSQALSSGGAFYSAFVDMENNTCDFENETFYKLLRYIKTLPTELPANNYNEDNQYENYQNGKTAIYGAYMSGANDWLRLELVFNTKDYTIIGMPIMHEGDRGGALSYNTSYTITSFCENTDIAWSFIKSVISPEYNSLRDSWGRIYNFSVLKSIYEKQCDEALHSRFKLYFDGSTSWSSYDPDNPEDEDVMIGGMNMDSPGIVAYFTEEDMKNLENYLDNEVGASTQTAIPDEISSIINEEISAFISGIKSAEDCAKVVQSRVKLWLSEHE